MVLAVNVNEKERGANLARRSDAPTLVIDDRPAVLLDQQVHTTAWVHLGVGVA
jgi:hypothetical protein